jgi:DNA-binding NarL/FixJ family response regulator
MSVTPFPILLADNDPLFRDAIKTLLAEKPEMRVIGEAGDGIELLRLLDYLKQKGSAPQLVILDLSMPGLGGMQALSSIGNTIPDMKVLVLTMHKEIEFVYQALAVGAKGYMLKDEVGTRIFSAIDEIKDGKIYISPLVKNGRF